MSTQQSDHKPGSFWGSIAETLRKRFGGQRQQQEQSAEGPVCCLPDDTVHIAFRGVSDERMYLSKNRNWADVPYFKPKGLRVFCAGCRRRLL